MAGYRSIVAKGDQADLAGDVGSVRPPAAKPDSIDCKQAGGYK